MRYEIAEILFKNNQLDSEGLILKVKSTESVWIEEMLLGWMDGRTLRLHIIQWRIDID